MSVLLNERDFYDLTTAYLIRDVADGDVAFKIGGRQVVEIPFGQQDAHPCVLEIEEFLQIGEILGGLQLIDRSIGQRHIIGLRDFEHQLRFEAALDMEVQFGLRQAADKIV